MNIDQDYKILQRARLYFDIRITYYFLIIQINLNLGKNHYNCNPDVGEDVAIALTVKIYD
jgi:hypothetical protein